MRGEGKGMRHEGKGMRHEGKGMWDEVVEMVREKQISR
jgi:hypothetical protein